MKFKNIWQNPKKQVIINNSRFGIEVSSDMKTVEVTGGIKTQQLQEDELGKYFIIVTMKYYVIYKTKDVVLEQLGVVEKQIEILSEKYDLSPISGRKELNKSFDKVRNIAKKINQIYKLNSEEQKLVDVWILSETLFNEKYGSIEKINEFIEDDIILDEAMCNPESQI